MSKYYNKPTLSARMTDTLVSTAMRHIAKKAIYALDATITFMENDLKQTTIRCGGCFKLCRYNFENVYTVCSHCRIWS